jgi:hypothetical protein
MDFIESHLQATAFLAAIFGGGLAGASLNQFVNWLRRPVLRVVFDDIGRD